MLLRDKLNSNIFSNSEKIIIDYLLKNIDTIESMTTSSIAEATYTNITSIIRIAKKLNLNGWTTLKNELIKERNYLNSTINNVDANQPFSSKDTELTIANKIATLMKESVDDTLNLVDIEEVKNICKLIYKKRNVMIFAGKTNVSILNHFAYIMRRLNFNVQISSHYDYPKFEAYNLDQNSVAFFMSYSGNNPDILPYLSIVKRKNIDVISITSRGENTVSQNSKYNLAMSTQEKLYSKIGHINTMSSLLYLLELIYSVIFSMDYEENYKHTVAMNQEIETRTSDNTRIEENP